jgi:hypothetical protein
MRHLTVFSPFCFSVHFLLLSASKAKRVEEKQIALTKAEADLAKLPSEAELMEELVSDFFSAPS